MSVKGRLCGERGMSRCATERGRWDRLEMQIVKVNCSTFIPHLTRHLIEPGLGLEESGLRGIRQDLKIKKI
jgi:hypothetical protein